MAGKEKVDIKRSDQFQEVDAELTRAMEDLDSTIDRVSAIFDAAADETGDDAPPPAVTETAGTDVDAAGGEAVAEGQAPETVKPDAPKSEDS